MSVKDEPSIEVEPPLTMSPATTTPSDLDPSDATHPSVVWQKLQPRSGGDPLDRTKANWISWSRAATHAFDMSGLGDHILPSPASDAPNASRQPVAFRNWTKNDRAVRAYILDGCAPEEEKLVKHHLTARTCWDALRERHENQGPIRQAQLIERVVGKTFVRDADMLKTVHSQIHDLNMAFDMPGGLSKETFICVVLLMNMGHGLDHLRANAQRDLHKSTKEEPFTVQHLLSYIESEHDVILSESSRSTSTSLALAATSTDRHSEIRCKCCKKTGHVDQYCIKPGGGMAGKTITEARAQRLKDSGKSKSSSRGGASSSTSVASIPAGKIAFNGTDSTGKAFVMYVDANSLAPAPATDTAAYAGLPSIQVDSPSFQPSNDFHYVLSTDKLEGLDTAYTAASTNDDDFIEYQSSVDWNIQIRPVEDIMLSASPVHSAIHTPLSMSDHPYHADSAASCHLSPEKHDFVNLRPAINRRIRGVNGLVINATGIGDVTLIVDDSGTLLTLKDVLYIPQATVRLLSVSSLARSSMIDSHFNDEVCWFTHRSTNKIIAHGTLQSSNLYAIKTAGSGITIPDSALSSVDNKVHELHKWHLKLGHANYGVIQTMARSDTISGMSPSLANVPPPKCDACILGKQTKALVPKKRQEGEGHRATRRLEKVFVDLQGPHVVQARGHYRYTMNIIDDFTSRVWSIALKNKDEAAPRLQAWTILQENLTKERVSTFYFDNGELKSDKMMTWFSQHGLDWVTTAPYTSAHIGRVERVHRTLMGKSRAMRLHARCPLDMWIEFYMTASYLHNRTAVSSLPNAITPYEAWHKRLPDYSHMREIGSRCFVLIQNRHNPKLYARSIECVLVGYDLHSKTYRCYQRESRTIYSSFHVRFVEHDEELPPVPTPPHAPPTMSSTLADIARGASDCPLPFYDDEDDCLPPDYRRPLRKHEPMGIYNYLFTK